MTNLSPTELRERATAHEQEAIDSFERSDTDGFLSQWASGINASVDRLQATITENGGLSDFAALFRDGELVPAVQIETRYGWRWAIFETAEAANSYGGNIIEWVGLSERALANKGYTMGKVWRPAYAKVLAPKGARGLSGAASAFAGHALQSGEPRFDPNAEVLTTNVFDKEQ
jgi:hypothetical protein